VWINCDGDVAMNIDEKGFVKGATPEHWKHLDDYFAKARKHKVYIMATMLSFDHFKDERKNHKLWHKWINDDEALDSYINSYLIPFVKRYRDNPYLWSIDLTNEPDWITNIDGKGSIDFRRFTRFYAKAAKAIHENSDILVTVGIGVVKHNSDADGMVANFVSDTRMRAEVDDAKARLDFWSPHYYPWQEEWFGIPFYVTPEQYKLPDDRPSVVGESPAKASTGHTLDQDYQSAFEKGWQGVLPWTSNGVDANGGFADVIKGTAPFAKAHPKLVFPLVTGK
jgi:hypothetical protein